MVCLDSSYPKFVLGPGFFVVEFECAAQNSFRFLDFTVARRVCMLLKKEIGDWPFEWAMQARDWPVL